MTELARPTGVSLRTAIETERLLLRPARSTDIAALAAALRRNDTHLRPWSPLQTPQKSERRVSLAAVAKEVAAARRAWRRDDAYIFLLFARGSAKEKGAIVGRINLGRVLRGPFQNSFLGYWIDAAYQGQGLMTEAVAAVVQFAFGDLGLHRVQASVMPRNRASVRVVEKVGFRYEGLSRSYLQIAGKWEDHAIYAVTREDGRRIRRRPAMVGPSCNAR